MQMLLFLNNKNSCRQDDNKKIEYRHFIYLKCVITHKDPINDKN